MTDSLPLPLARHAPDAAVSFGADGARTARDLLRDAAAIAAQLPEPTDGSHLVMMFRSDRYAFAAALLGAWAGGHAVALPPNLRRDTVQATLDRPESVGILHDTASSLGVRVPDLLGEAGAPGPALPAAVVPDRPVAATTFTSGSTGGARPWPKSAAQLLGEIGVQAQVFAELPGARVLPTVPPTHIYGLLFGVLAPLATGGAFLRAIPSPFQPGTIAAVVRDHAPTVLVSVPVHLRACEALPTGALEGLRFAMSSAGPLPLETAAMMRARHGLRVHEVFGSTETGGIARRVQTDDPGWVPLPGVSVDTDADGHLRVGSPFLDEGLAQPYRTADLAELRPDGAFLHRGRADGVVKVGGKRVSLPAMEAALGALPGVEDAAVVAVSDAGGRGARLYAAVAADPAKWTSDGLRDALKARFEPSTLPRRIAMRGLDVGLPRETNGKLQRAQLLQSFGLDPTGAPLTLSLDWRSDEPLQGLPEGEAGHRFEVHVPEDYAWYEGHFPGYPVMAGVVQLHELVLPTVARVRPELGALEGMTRVKFTGRITPGDTVTLELRWKGDAPAVQFAIDKPGESCAAGRLSFAARADGPGEGAE